MTLSPLSSPDPIPTRYSLLSRLHDWDDQESWRQFFDTYWRLIYHIARQAGLSEAEAQDVVQETVMCVAKDIAKFRRRPELGSFKGWLRNIIRWRVADQFRLRGARHQPGIETETVETTTTPAELPQSDSPWEAIWEQEWHQNLLTAAMSQVKAEIKAEHFQVFDLWVLQGVPLAEVTKRLGVNLAQAYLIKHRVSKLIKKRVAGLEKKFA